MSRSHPNARPTWFRLSEDSWAKIADEYKNGATADELSAKWKVAARTVYRRAGQHGWTKKAHGDAVAREHAAAFEAQAEAARRAALGGAGPLPGELWPTGDEDADGSGPTPPPLSTDPSDLKAATLARLAAAIREGRDQEALRLTTLVDKLGKLSASGETGREAFDDDYDPERARLMLTGFVDWRPTRAHVEHETAYMFRTIFLLALFMLEKPESVPGLFKRRVMRFRRDYLGEDDPEALEAAEELTDYLLAGYDQLFMDFTEDEPRPARKLPCRTWPPPRPPYPSRKALAKEATPLPPAEPRPGAVLYGRRR
ncbi:hypothetical protein [Caulobacter sp. BP25]|uniref:hypothetical protein n=1 Tax=Caulobacter sp. BP25 TaxID=2048900 RepID=UPI000C12CDE3|nr:hypothetical protein [Caulobacter sp. BP25]PHY17177.1 hypothetical protein CSW59_19270 [Caulobacter sp. BP25]